MSNLNFDATRIEPDSGQPEPIPAGEYRCVVIESDVCKTKDGTGSYLKTVLQVIDGPFEGRKIYHNITLQNRNAEAQRIGLAQLSALCHATGRLQVTDSVELHDIPVMVRVAIKPSQEYGPQNVVRGFKPAGQSAPQQQRQQHTPQFAPPQPQRPAKRPWEQG